MCREVFIALLTMLYYVQNATIKMPILCNGAYLAQPPCWRPWGRHDKDGPAIKDAHQTYPWKEHHWEN